MPDLNNIPKPTKKLELKLNFNPKTILVWLFVGLMILSLAFSLSSNNQPSGGEVPLSQALSDIKENKVDSVKVEQDQLILTYKDGKIFDARKENKDSITKIFADAGIDPTSIKTEIVNQSLSQIWGDILGTLLPLILMGVFFFFIIRQTRGAQDSIFSFGQSKARLFSKGKQGITFKDIAGVDEAKKELEEVVDFLKHPGKYRMLGARTPKGVLLVGPAGVGKTLLAKAVAGEAGVPFFSMAGSEFMEMLVGVGAARVRDLFTNAKKSAPAIIFIDEIDAIGRARGNGLTGGHDEREQTLNQILVEMDGFTPNDNVMVIAATNRGDLLDTALLRPGRFDRRIILDMPDLEARKAILKIHARGKPFSLDVSWDQIAKKTVSFSGADLENMLNEAAILTAREGKKAITMAEINEAAIKVKLGPAKRRIQTDEDKKITAYHEAGHAIVTYVMPHLDPVSRISIVARGVSLGHTLVPPQDRTHETKTRLTEQIAALLGGRAAESLIFDEMTTGASSDIEQATRISRSMVEELGMSILGPTNLGPQTETSDLGKTLWADPTQLSQEWASKVDNEVVKLVDGGYKEAKVILKKNREKLDAVAAKLMEIETLEQEDFEKIMKD